MWFGPMGRIGKRFLEDLHLITSTAAKLPGKVAVPSSSRFSRPASDVRENQNNVVFSNGEALVMDVRAGMTPAEHVQRKLMSLLHG